MSKFFDHFELTSTDDLTSLIGGVEVVLICCTRGEAAQLVQCVQKLEHLQDIKAVTIGSSEFYELTRIGKVAVCSHGMGQASVSICLEELTGLLLEAGCKKITYLRVCSSFGIGIPAGALVATTECLSDKLTTDLNIISQGVDSALNLSGHLDLADEIRIANEGKLDVILGKTISCGTFYEGQARLEGSIAEYSEAEKLEYVSKAKTAGAIIFDMEGGILANHCKNHVGVRCGMVSAVKMDGLKSQKSLGGYTTQDFDAWENAIRAATNWLEKYLKDEYASGSHKKLNTLDNAVTSVNKICPAMKARMVAGVRTKPSRTSSKEVTVAATAEGKSDVNSPEIIKQNLQYQRTWDGRTARSFMPPVPRKEKFLRQSQGFQPVKLSKHANQHMRKQRNIMQPRKITHSKLGRV